MKKSIILGVFFSAVVILLTVHITFGGADPFTTITTVPNSLNLTVSPDGTVTGSRNVDIKFVRNHYGFGCTHIHYIFGQAIGQLPRFLPYNKPNLCGFTRSLKDTIPVDQISAVCQDKWGSTVTTYQNYQTKMVNTDLHLEQVLIEDIIGSLTAPLVGVPVQGSTRLLNELGINFNHSWEKDISMPITINCECTSPRFTGNDMPRATASQSYSHDFKSQVTSGKEPYHFSVSGDLPPGLTLNQDGVLSGTPLHGGFYQFQVNMDDSCSLETQNTSENFGLLVCADMLFFDPSATLPVGFVGSSYSEYIHIVAGFTPITVSVLDPNDLPPGLAFNPTGGFSGIPTSPGTYDFTVRVVDYCNYVKEKRVSLKINPKPLPGSKGFIRGKMVPGKVYGTRTPLALKPSQQEVSPETGFKHPPPDFNPDNPKPEPPGNQGQPISKTLEPLQPAQPKRAPVKLIGEKDSRRMLTTTPERKPATAVQPPRIIPQRLAEKPKMAPVDKSLPAMQQTGQKAVLPKTMKSSRGNVAIDTVPLPDKPAAMKKPVKRVPKTIEMARKEAHPQPKAGIAPIPPTPRPVRVAPAKKSPVQVGRVTSKNTIGKTKQAGIIDTNTKSARIPATQGAAKKPVATRAAPRALSKQTRAIVTKPPVPTRSVLKTAPKAPFPVKKEISRKPSAGKTEKTGIIFVNRDPRMIRSRQLQVAGQQVTIVITGGNLDKIRSAQVLDMHNRAIPSTEVRVMRIQCDKPTELKVTLKAFSMPKGGGTYKLVLRGGNKLVDTPVRLEIIAAQKKRMMPGSVLPIQKKR